MSTTMGQTNLGQGRGEGGTQTTSRQGESQTAMSQGPHAEGQIARTIEQQTAKLPSDVFLWAALASMGASAALRFMGKKNVSLFIGDWVSPLLLFGVYNKIVKIEGSDRGH